ncbi:Long-chain-fatty-acid--CoA ligase [Cupriavidus yeoncheonensis]|uniref:Long-chain-fatty-acid--CoA ligase n=1 Tax=Cupriavidus yeoncheonensis TaxID=1462994 RepID=A0A916N6X3_9BURK|nr:AMP-binding protein [Cupriavidus yeoncheonensis]CAG2154979.1 Long-chain-fatty-acid--CoA ligase [Cupriavidus yeoncheonensis]
MPRLTRHFAHWPPGAPRTLDVADCNLFSHLEDSAARLPDKPAAIFYGKPTTFREMQAAAVALAGYLQQRLGVRRGDRVLLLMQTCPQFYASFYAVMRCDAVVVALNPMSTPDEIAYFAADSGARVLVATQDVAGRAVTLMDDGTLDACVVGALSDFAAPPEASPWLELPAIVREPRRAMPHPRCHDMAAALAAGAQPAPAQAKGEDLAVIGYTSGTTGKPKGAMLSHRNFCYTLAHRAHWQDDREDEDELLALPASHLAGMRVMLQAGRIGRTLVMLARWDAKAAVELIHRLRIRSWPTVPTMLSEVLGAADDAAHALSSLMRLYGGAAAMPDALAREIQERLGLVFLESYGMTEFCGLALSNPPQAARRQCAGVPVINCDVRIIDPVTLEELGPDQPGEIVMHGPTLFAGYLNKPEATAETHIEIDGKRFLRSGDLGYQDDDGYFYVTDRLKRMINSSGLKVWPAEIELALYGHPAVQEACVISARDPHRGETPKALIVLRPAARGTVKADDLIAWAREQIAAYKVPRIVEIVEALPKTATGKILWRVLQEEQDREERKALSTS